MWRIFAWFVKDAKVNLESHCWCYVKLLGGILKHLGVKCIGVELQKSAQLYRNANS